jgi:hypothetical protein
MRDDANVYISFACRAFPSWKQPALHVHFAGRIVEQPAMLPSPPEKGDAARLREQDGRVACEMKAHGEP